MDENGNADTEDPIVKREEYSVNSGVPTTIHLLMYGAPEEGTCYTRDPTYKYGG